jgi:hypothetical protein
MRTYYVYVYLRKNGTPYYVGKGCGKRCHVRSGRVISPPSDPSRILILKEKLSESEAFKLERDLIYIFGRIDLGTGILHNRTNGGDGSSGYVRSPELREKDRQIKLVSNPCLGKKRWHNLESQKEKVSLDCPGPGWILGRLPSMAEVLRNNRKNQEMGLLPNPRSGRSHSKKGKNNISESKKGKKGYVNQEGQIVFRDAPPGPEWQPGRKWRG